MKKSIVLDPPRSAADNGHDETPNRLAGEQSLHVVCRGLRPLLQTNPRSIQLSDPYAVIARRISNEIKAVRKKKDEGAEERLVELETKMAFNDFCMSAYWSDAERRFFLPDGTVLAAIKESAKAGRMGKDIDRAVRMEETEIYFDNVPSCKSLEEAFKIPELVFGGPCRIPPRTGTLVWKTRCCMPTGWTLRFTLLFMPYQISVKTLKEIVIRAGLEIGFGSWRPKFGRFEAEFE